MAFTSNIFKHIISIGYEFETHDISKISIKLLNQIGGFVNLLDSEYSFSLQVTTVYDLNKTFESAVEDQFN